MTTTKQVESLTTFDFITSDIIDNMSQEENTQNNSEIDYSAFPEDEGDSENTCISCQ